MLDPSSVKRILIIRTDRIGDVVLSTPVIKVLRSVLPKAHIAFMTGKNTQDILKFNPDLDEVIVYDKLHAHRSWWNTLCFALRLRQKSFDWAIILHSTNRVIWIATLAGITHRVGYARRLGCFLTESLPYIKAEGQKHEVEYNFDLLKKIGVMEDATKLVWNVSSTEEEQIEKRLEGWGIEKQDQIIAVHPDASSPSKRWSVTKFIKLCNQLTEDSDKKVVLVAGSEGVHLTRQIVDQTKKGVLDLGGLLNLRELAALFKRCEWVISNDSGPVHISTAVGTPVVSIFGRKKKGLGPERWRPLGARDRVLQKDPGCEPCIPEPCPIQLECLESLSVQEVLEHIS
jgi:heptosyltransferase II